LRADGGGKNGTGVGLSSAVLFDGKDPFNPINRRINIIVMNKMAEESVALMEVQSKWKLKADRLSSSL